MKTLLINCSLIIIVLVSCLPTEDSYTPEQSKIIGTPINIGNLEVAQNDFPEYMTWSQAVKSCKALGSGWRLPTKSELNLLYKNKDKIGGFGDYQYYWSSTKFSNDYAWVQSFNHGGQYDANKNYSYGSGVRAVRSF